jgi:hypothetical protein
VHGALEDIALDRSERDSARRGLISRRTACASESRVVRNRARPSVPA